MKRIAGAIIAVLICLTAAPSIGYAQAPGRGRGGPGRGVPAYDPATELTIQGTVEEVSQLKTPAMGTHLTLKTDKENFDVRLGPSAFLTANKFEFAKGDQIEVTGSKIKVAGADAILAREVKKGGQTLTLRDAKGIPRWSRGGRS